MTHPSEESVNASHWIAPTRRLLMKGVLAGAAALLLRSTRGRAGEPAACVFFA